MKEKAIPEARWCGEEWMTWKDLNVEPIRAEDLNRPRQREPNPLLELVKKRKVAA